MSSRPSPDAAPDFFAIATELEMLSGEVARDVVREATAGNVTPTQIVLQKGLLEAVQVDIIETLLHPTEIVPGYEILNLIGKGGMGVVYRARQQALDRIVALKTVLVGQMGDPSMVSRFEQEAITVARLRHPNIVAAYDFGRHAGRLYFIMELVEGDDVDNLIAQRGRLEETTVLRLARQVAAGLSHAAHIGIVHRDIKPANLLLVEAPDDASRSEGLPMVKIADFGLAFLTTDRETRTRLTADKATIGSPHYMAPEQIDGESVDYRADIYSLGATMYHMLAGQPPFTGKTLSQILMQKLSGETPCLQENCPEVLAETSELITAMLDRDPARRIADYARLIERIDHLIRLSDPAAQSPQTAEISTGTLHGELEATQLVKRTLPRPDVRRKIGRSTVIATVVAAVTIAALIASWPFLFDQTDATHTGPRMVRSGWSKPLFDGRRLAALPSSGSWNVGPDDEGGIVISGTNGMICQTLNRNDLDEPRPLENYRLQLFVHLHEALAVEVHFAIDADPTLDGRRTALRITKEGAVLARQTSEQRTLEPVTEAIELTGVADKYHVVAIERQHRHWRVLCDDQLVGTVPATAEPQLSKFCLVAEGGPAWFSDIEVDELVEADPDAH
jgi:serine/threonine protein kinase